MAEEKRATGITIIAIGKLLKSIALLALGIAAFSAVGKDIPHTLGHWADILRVDPHNHYVVRGIATLSGQDRRRLHEIGIGTFFYAALFLVEGGGLWFRKHWAEWFSIGITTSFVPLEIWEITKHASAGRIVALVLNIAAVTYLFVHARQRKKRASR